MEREFQKQQYVVGHERMYLANALNLTEAQVNMSHPLHISTNLIRENNILDDKHV